MQFKIPFLILITWFSTFLPASAQTNYSRKISLSGQYNYSTRFNSWHFSAPQIGIGWQNKKHNWHELDLTEMQVSKSSEHHVLSGSLRYQYSIMPFKRFENTRFKPFIGIGATASSSHSLTQVNFVSNYDIRHFTTALRAHVSPGIEYNFSKRFYGSLQLPISLMSFKTVDSRLFDPNLSAEDQKRSTANLKLFPLDGVEARLTIGYKF
jgi:hypothetical protein